MHTCANFVHVVSSVSAWPVGVPSSGLGAQRRGPQRTFLAVQAVLPITWDEDACLQHEIHQLRALLVEHLAQQPCNILQALSNILTCGHYASMQHSLKANVLRHGMQVSAAAPPFVLGAHGEHQHSVTQVAQAAQTLRRVTSD